MNKTIYINGHDLTIEDVVSVARHNTPVALDEKAKDGIIRARKYVEKVLDEGKVVYGINTGFGKFSNVAISSEDLDQLQKNLIYADAAGIGRPFDTEIVRVMMLLRANAISTGNSGVFVETVEILLEMLNKGVHPIVREKGSVGASGDLCPLSHMVLVMMGEGEAEYKGVLMSGKEAMEKAGIEPVILRAKEGLALINGTQAMMGVGVLAAYDADVIMKSADVIAGLTVEALQGITDAYDERIHLARPHSGQINTAKNLLKVVEGSSFTTRQGEKRLQDAYGVRCIPQIHGASRMAIDYVRAVVETQINSVTDNPIIFPDGDDPAIYSGGNFHGQPIAIAMDTLSIAIAEFANISERRIERLVNPALSNGLPAFLVKKGGLNCGFMIPQYAAAALVSENKVLAHPASVDSIPTSANQEDHVSMGTIAARHARIIIEHAQSVLGIELMSAAQAIDLREKGKLGQGSQIAYDLLREEVTFMEDDRIFYLDMDKAKDMVASKELLNRVEDKIGKLR